MKIEGGSCYTYPMIEVTPSIFIDESEIQLDFIRSSGPGGQNVNGVCTKTLTSLQTTRLPSRSRLLRE